MSGRNRAVLVVCPDCGRERTVQARPSAAGRRCARCNALYARQLATARQAEVDDVVVDRLTAGFRVKSTSAERRAAVAVLSRRGLTCELIAARMHTTPRAVQRMRSELRRGAA